MVTAMNRLLVRFGITGGIPLLLVLATGCGTTPPARSEAQVRAETALNRGIRAEHRGDAPEAERLLTQSMTTSSSIEDYPLQTMALINLARLYRLRPDLAKADTFIDRAIKTTAMDTRYSAEAAYEKALIELAKGSPATAQAWAQKAIETERGNSLGSRLNLAARIQLVRGMVDDAQALAGKALIENRSAGHPEEEANSLRILGMIARNEHNHERGIQFLQEALQIDKRIGKSSKIAADLAELAESARSAGRLSESAIYLERASEVNRAGGRVEQAIENQERLAGVYTQLGNEQKALRARETARRLAIPDAVQQPGSSSTTISPSSKP